MLKALMPDNAPHKRLRNFVLTKHRLRLSFCLINFGTQVARLYGRKQWTIIIIVVILVRLWKLYGVLFDSLFYVFEMINLPVSWVWVSVLYNLVNNNRELDFRLSLVQRSCNGFTNDSIWLSLSVVTRTGLYDQITSRPSYVKDTYPLFPWAIC